MLFLSGDGSRQIPFLWAVIAELSVIAALDLHNVFGIIDVVLHTLVE